MPAGVVSATNRENSLDILICPDYTDKGCTHTPDKGQKLPDKHAIYNFTLQAPNDVPFHEYVANCAKTALVMHTDANAAPEKESTFDNVVGMKL